MPDLGSACRLTALSFTPAVRAWLTHTRDPRLMHVFGRACNLLNERREVLSIVTPQIGNGPFNLVVENDVLLINGLHAESPVSIGADRLILADLTIHTAEAELWSPRPNWEMLHVERDSIFNQLTLLQIPHCQPSLPASLLSTLSISVAAADLPASLTVARKLAGLGIGLTPAGDDFILGALLAAWIIHPPEVAGILAGGIANAVAPLTTSLSAAWLRAAGKGEAGVLWHRFFDASVSGDPVQIQHALEEILAVGETSGADALAGFIGVFSDWMEHEGKELAAN